MDWTMMDNGVKKYDMTDQDHLLHEACKHIKWTVTNWTWTEHVKTHGWHTKNQNTQHKMLYFNHSHIYNIMYYMATFKYISGSFDR